MEAQKSSEAARARQSRKSIAHIPSMDLGGDKENLSVDSAALSSITLQVKHTAKKSRSKSVGPGGLAALKEGAGNKGEPSPPHVRSILKPTIALSPPKTIPPRDDACNASPKKSNGPKTPEKSPKKSPKAKAGDLGQQDLPDPFKKSPKISTSLALSPTKSPTRVAVRTEEEQQASAKERERQEALAHKDARRKSLANRRVSFAPEATLHTWNVVEMPEDSTTSSASTNATRRRSGLTANAGSPFIAPQSPMPSSDASEAPSTPPEQIEEVQVSASPADQHDLHQKKRRRSSKIPPMNFNDPNDFSSSPMSGTSNDTGTQAFETAEEGSDSSSSDDKDLVEDETVTGVDGDDNTIHSAGGSSTGSSGRLEAVLREAANQAGTQGIDYDENGDITMEMADDEVTAAFKPWMKKGKYVPQVVGDPSALQDQENLNPFSPAFKANLNKKAEEQADGTMEITQAVGGILPTPEEAQASPKRRKRKSITSTAGKRRSSVTRRRSSGEVSVMGSDETMDLTTAIGGIQQNQQPNQKLNQADCADDDEELTMEFTSVLGGVVQLNNKGTESLNDAQLANIQLLQDANRRESDGSVVSEKDMDITFAAGGILPSITERTEPPEDKTVEMDITTAVGAILPQKLSTGNRAEAKTLMEQETDVGQLSGSPFQLGFPQKPVGAGVTDERPLPTHMHMGTMASETGSPSLMNSQPRSVTRRGAGLSQSVTPKPASRQPTPVKKTDTPSKQLTPHMVRPTTPGKTPPSKNVSMRNGSPKKLFKAEIKSEKKKAAESNPESGFKNPLFRKDSQTGATTPSIILKPRSRRSSGIGIDKEGLGSPRVTALLDRRGSIGENAKVFVAQGKPAAGVRFEDLQAMEQEIDQERAQEERRESGRGILQDEADTQDLREEKDATTNLKDMIERLTPQKRKLNGRKSLHVGTARGLLGKRPAELDDDEDEDGTPKRLKGREGSPVKKVKLPAPPPKLAPVGRVTRSSRLSLGETPVNALASTPSGNMPLSKINTTPKDQPRFKDAEKNPAKVASLEEKLDAASMGAVKLTEEEDRIQLQDFLNMTSIRFMELTTTKRRHTVVPNALLEQSARKASLGHEGLEQLGTGSDIESCVVAGACTVPMLELYQHSCRELKNYISEGRSVNKEIEAETYEDNPPLFREYMSAPPDVKAIMENQFKNIKTHARLLSKAMWYEWRMKLLEGLKSVLLRIGEGMDEDDRSLTQQEQILQPVLPGLIEKHDRMESHVQTSQAQADEMADCDQDELKEARNSLAVSERDLGAKRKLVEELQDQLREREDGLEYVVTRKQECVEDIKEAEKIRQDSRGWSSSEVSALQANVLELEETCGWSITSAVDSAVTMTYHRTLQLFLTPSSFNSNTIDSKFSASENAPISLTYIADTDEYHPKPLTTEKRFFLQIMRAQLQYLQQSQIHTKDLLSFISNSWQTACAITEEARMLGVSYITGPTITSDEAMAVRSVILLRAMKTKVEVCFDVKVRSGEGMKALRTDVGSGATVVYGEGLKEKKMGEFLEARVKDLGKEGKGGGWVVAVRELEERLAARGRKG